jgi:hypothetical protein
MPQTLNTISALFIACGINLFIEGAFAISGTFRSPSCMTCAILWPPFTAPRRSLLDADLPPARIKRLAGHICNASRRIQELLQDLLDISRGEIGVPEVCCLREVAMAASESPGRESRIIWHNAGGRSPAGD